MSQSKPKVSISDRIGAQIHMTLSKSFDRRIFFKKIDNNDENIFFWNK